MAADLPDNLMTNVSPTTGAAAPAAMSLAARFIGVITSPKATYRSIVAHPKWLGVLALTTVIVALFTSLPMTTPEGQQAWLDQQVRQREAWGGQVDDAQYEGMRKTAAFTPYITAGFIIVVSPIFAVIISGILFAVFNAAMGGEASFKQVFTVVASAGAVSALSAVFSGTINYFRGAVGSAANVAVLLPMVDENSFAGRLLGMIDIFFVWWLVVLAIGLGVLYRRRTQPIATGLFVVYGVVALCVAVVMSSFGGSN